ncbi:MAG: response regulator transcription factor [Ignavibacteriales bacterium]|nr:response regulator transcription factor [Ignavibacteriales bacterium]
MTNCIIVEDEPLATEIIEGYLKNFFDVFLLGKFENSITAFDFLKKKNVDLMFLDIRMPQVSGIDLLKILSHPPKVIITTAYRDFALEGYELDVVDYLLKPISLERFLKAMDKFYKSTEAHVNDSLILQKPADENFIYVKAERKIIKIYLKEIYFIESLKDYTILHLKNKKVITHQQISQLEEQLTCKGFIRIHRSYIVSVSKIEAVTSASIEIHGKELPIGRNYKNEVLKTLNLGKIITK